VPDYDVDDDGFAVLRSGRVVIFLEGDAMVVSIETGEVVLSQGGVQTQLREPGANGAIIDTNELVELRPDDYAAVFHFLTSIEIDEAPTPEQESTPTP
jgi:hypothetical protein